MRITAIDHLVLTVADIDRSIAFYSQVLGMRAITFGEGRHALTFGTQKINLHRQGAEIAPHASRPTAGSADLCLLTDTPLQHILDELAAHGIPTLTDIVPRSGAQGTIHSIYLRDPDGNLLELSHYPDENTP